MPQVLKIRDATMACGLLRDTETNILSMGPSHHPSQEQGSQRAPGKPQPQALRMSLGTGTSWLWAGTLLGSMAGQGTAVRNWRPTVLQHSWNRGWWPWGLSCPPGGWAGWRSSVGGQGQTCRPPGSWHCVTPHTQLNANEWTEKQKAMAQILFVHWYK